MAAAATPRPTVAPSGGRFEIVSTITLGLAGLWCVALLIGAMTVPVYAGTSSGSSSTWRATLVEVNGVGALGVVALPVIPVVVVALALWMRHRAQRRGAGPVAWTTVGILGLFAFVTGFTIGMFVVPIVVLLVIACVMTNAPPRPGERPVTSRAHRGDRLSISNCAAIGVAVAAPVGGLVGLVLGLRANPPTAWFAVFEVGLPAAVLGGFIGLFVGTLVFLGRWLHRVL